MKKCCTDCGRIIDMGAPRCDSCAERHRANVKARRAADPVRVARDAMYATSRWREVRAGVLERAGGCCEECGADGPLDCAHVVETTQLIGNPEAFYDPDLLLALCRSCHRLLDASRSRVRVP